LTFFITLRRMANYPVESLKTGGFGWVTDLSIADPFYILPIVNCLTLWASLEVSFRSGKFWELHLRVAALFSLNETKIKWN